MGWKRRAFHVALTGCPDRHYLRQRRRARSAGHLLCSRYTRRRRWLDKAEISIIDDSISTGLSFRSSAYFSRSLHGADSDGSPLQRVYSPRPSAMSRVWWLRIKAFTGAVAHRWAIRKAVSRQRPSWCLNPAPYPLHPLPRVNPYFRVPPHSRTLLGERTWKKMTLDLIS